jgi:hypothetical protein
MYLYQHRPYSPMYTLPLYYYIENLASRKNKERKEERKRNQEKASKCFTLMAFIARRGII